LAKDLNYITEIEFNNLTILLNNVKAMLLSLIKKMRT
jgi:hypothetical protein